MSKCEAGCISFTGGEKRHHKDCTYYKDSFTEMHDNLESKLKAQQEVIDELAEALRFYFTNTQSGHFDNDFINDNVTDRRARQALAKLEAR